MSRVYRFLALGLAALLLAPTAAVPQSDRRPPPAREPQRHPPDDPNRQARPREPNPERAPARPQPGRADRDRDRDRDRRAVPVGRRPVVVRGRVFVRGYFYDPFLGPYPWWPYGAYPYWYAPLYEMRAFLRVKATPRDASVYADGYYAGLVDDFDGRFQSLPLTPGGHRIVLYREGYRSSTHHVYLQRGATLTLTVALAPLARGEPQPPPPVPLPEPWSDETSAAVPSAGTMLDPDSN